MLVVILAGGDRYTVTDSLWSEEPRSQEKLAGA